VLPLPVRADGMRAQWPSSTVVLSWPASREPLFQRLCSNGHGSELAGLRAERSWQSVREAQAGYEAKDCIAGHVR
jgi:hypothetical protein